MSNASTSACCARSPRRWPPTWTSDACSKWRSITARGCSMRPTRACGWSAPGGELSLRGGARVHPFRDVHPTTGGRQRLGPGRPPADRQPGRRAARPELVFQSRVRRAHRAGRLPRRGSVARGRIARRARSHAPDRPPFQPGRGAIAGQPGQRRRRRREQRAHPRGRGRAARGRRGQIRVAASLGLRSDRLGRAGVRRRWRGHQRQRRGRADPRSQPGVDARHDARPTSILARSKTAVR